MENVLLKMHYGSNCVDVKVDDTDKCLLIDVINDMYDEAEKHDVPIPRHASLGYNYMMKPNTLNNDKELMEMFSRFNGVKEIDIWLGELSAPSTILILARNVRACNKDAPNVNVVPTQASVFRQKIPVRREPVAINHTPKRTIFISSHIQTPNETDSPSLQEISAYLPSQNMSSTPVISPKRYDRVDGSSQYDVRYSQASIDNYSPRASPIQHVNVSNSPHFSLRRSVKFTKSSLYNSSFGNVVIQPESQPKTNKSTPVLYSVQKSMSSQTQLQPKYKMPRATAKMKGIYIPKTTARDRIVLHKTREIKTRGLRLEYETINDNESDSDSEYAPVSDDVVDDEEEDLTDLDDKDTIVMEHLHYIDDGYIPFQQHHWTGDDDYSEALFNNSELYESKEFGNVQLRPWMIFMDKEHFKDTLRDFCIQEGFYVIVDKADNKRYSAECATVGCEWRIHASVLPDGLTWAIKSIRKHDHGCKGIKEHNPMANVEWAAKKMMEDIRENENISAKAINKLLMKRYGVQMKSSTIYKMKDCALEIINGGHDESYNLLPAYCEIVKLTNPGSFALCAWGYMNNPQRSLQFKSIFVSFKAQSEGLIIGCRSLLGVDGTHLKGNHGGVLLSAVALDGNGEIFPVAVSVVESENKQNWSNFFWHLKQLIKDSGRTNWTIISDRQKGIEPALDTVWPEARRRYCARHICANYKTHYPDILMYNLFWRVVNSCSEFTFKKAVEQVVKKAGLGCARWFLDLGDKSAWARHMFDSSLSCDHNSSNFVESFNSTLSVHRCNPILSLLEGVRRTIMVSNATRQNVADSWPDDGICPNVAIKLRALKQEAKFCHAFPSAKGEFEVHEGKSSLKVSLNKWTCACGEWQINGIPCRHAIKAILTSDSDPQDFVSEWFSARLYKATYGMSINPIPDKEQWPAFDVPELEPPTLKRSIGRPSRNRKREQGEQRKGKRSFTVKCKRCGCVGHNSKTCKGGLTTKEKQQQEASITNKTKGKKRAAETPLFRSINDLERAASSITQQSEAGPSDVMNKKT